MKRGNLLWTGSRMMLSEHRQALNNRLAETNEEYDLELEIDQQQFEQWQDILNELAKNPELVVKILYGKEKKQLIGHLIAWDSNQQVIYIEDHDEQRIKVPFREIRYFERYQ